MNGQMWVLELFYGGLWIVAFSLMMHAVQRQQRAERALLVALERLLMLGSMTYDSNTKESIYWTIDSMLKCLDSEKTKKIMAKDEAKKLMKDMGIS